MLSAERDLLPFFVLGDDDRAAARIARRQAERPENWRGLGSMTDVAPVCRIGAPEFLHARCALVVSVCRAVGRVCLARQMTVAFFYGEEPSAAPLPVLEDLARMLGFCGSARNWIVEPRGGAITIAQEFVPGAYLIILER